MVPRSRSVLSALSAAVLVAAPLGAPVLAGAPAPSAPAPAPAAPAAPPAPEGVVVVEAVDLPLGVTQAADGSLVVAHPDGLGPASKQEVGRSLPGGGNATVQTSGTTTTVPVEGDGVHDLRYLDTDTADWTILGIGRALAVVEDGRLVDVEQISAPRGQEVRLWQAGPGAVRVVVPADRADLVHWSLHQGAVPVRLNTDHLPVTVVRDLPDGRYSLSAGTADQPGPLTASTISFTLVDGWIAR